MQRGGRPSSSMVPERALSPPGESGPIDPFSYNMLMALSALPFLPGVQAREKQPAEPPALLRRRAASDGQYENQSPEPSSPRSPGVRSPVQCVSPELALTIALNPGGRPKEVSP